MLDPRPYRVVTRRPGHGTALIWAEEAGVGEPLEIPALQFLAIFGAPPPADGARMVMRFELKTPPPERSAHVH